MRKVVLRSSPLERDVSLTSSIRVVTFGCRLNLYESEAMRELAMQAGLDDVTIINSCAVTSEAERQVRQAIRKAKKERPEGCVVLAGCAAQIDPEKYAAMPEVDAVLGNEAKMKAETFVAIKQKTGRVFHSDLSKIKAAVAPLVSGFSDGLTRGFVPVQNGCDHCCTYCAIPFGRGPSRSVPLQRITEQVRLLLHEGCAEISLTGVDMTSYGADLPGNPGFGLMIKRLLMDVPELRRLRLSSLDPIEVDEELWRLIENEPRLMPHLHLSLQAGDDLILTRMKRRHRRQDIVDFVSRARRVRPGIAFGADLIAGFPTETEEMFQNTCALLEELDLTWLHVFPYSPRKGTPAARMPQIPSSVRKDRAAKLRKIGKVAVHRHLGSLIGQEMEVHIEQPQVARAPTFAEVRLLTPGVAGQVVRVKGIAREGDRLVVERKE